MTDQFVCEQAEFVELDRECLARGLYVGGPHCSGRSTHG
jgi:hypothetical protein